MWLVPYKFAQKITEDVDFRIMGTFVEFYTTLLGFVNFRLYTSIGLVYPPRFDKSSDDKGGELGAFTLEGSGRRESRPAIKHSDDNEGTRKSEPIQNGGDSTAQKIATLPSLAELQPENMPEEEELDNGHIEGHESTQAIDKFEVAAGGEADDLVQPEYTDSDGPNQLFEPFTFFLGRETPRQPLEFILRAFGCKRVGWDAVLGDGAFLTDENDARITHQVVDRPPIVLQANTEDEYEDDDEEIRGTALPQTAGNRVPGRTYIQPQWVWDCINAGKLVRPDHYAPGAELPPHLSPWIKPGKGQYDPSAPLATQEPEGEAEEALSDPEDMSEQEESLQEGVKEDDFVSAAKIKDQDGGMTVDISENSEAEEDEDEEWDGLEEESREESDEDASEEHALHQKELEAEAAGLPFSAASVSASEASSRTKLRDDARKKAARRRKEEEEELQRQKMMMSRSKRKILDKMLYSNRKKDDEAQNLRAKRRKLEKIASQT